MGNKLNLQPDQINDDSASMNMNVPVINRAKFEEDASKLNRYFGTLDLLDERLNFDKIVPFLEESLANSYFINLTMMKVLVEYSDLCGKYGSYYPISLKIIEQNLLAVLLVLWRVCPFEGAKQKVCKNWVHRPPDSLPYLTEHQWDLRMKKVYPQYNRALLMRSFKVHLRHVDKVL
jgi:hypothetical protein